MKRNDHFTERISSGHDHCGEFDETLFRSSSGQGVVMASDDTGE